MSTTKLLDDVVAHLKRGDDTATALQQARLTLRDDLAARVSRGESLESAIAQSGGPRRLAVPIRRMAVEMGGDETPQTLAGAIHMVVGGSGSVAGIPTAACLHRHLPPHRQPTPDEIKEAWRTCQNDPHS